MDLRTTLSLVSVTAGIFSAVLWWASSYFSKVSVAKLEDSEGEDGDIALQIDPATVWIFKSRRTARLNAAAAFFAGLAVAAQALLSLPNLM